MTKKKLYFAVKILISAAIILILIYTIKLETILEALANARRQGLIWAAALLPINLGLQFIKWRLLLRTVKMKPLFWEVMGSILVGFTLGLATPGRVGEFGRAFAVREIEPLKVVGLTIIDKFFNMACIAIFGGLGILILPGMILQQNVYIVISSVVVYLLGVFILVFILTHPAGVRGVLYSISLMLPKREKMKTLISCLDGINQYRARVLLGVSILFYFTFIGQFFLLVNSFGNLNLLEGFSGLSAIIFTKTFLPISVGGLGIGELAATRFLSLFRVEAAAAFNASLILFALNVLTPGLIGFLFIPRLKFGRNGK